MFEIIEYEKKSPSFENLWSYYLQANVLGPFYCWRYIEFLFLSTENDVIANRSMIVTMNNEPVAIAPVIIEKFNGHMQISSRGSYLPVAHVSYFLPRKIRKKIKTLLQNHFSEIVAAHRVSAAYGMIPPLSEFENKEYYNRLTDENYLDASSSTVILDLRLNASRLWGDIRKSYRPLIKRTETRFSFSILNAKNFKSDLFFQFPCLYRAAAGFDVYSTEAWNVLAEMVREGNGVLAFVKEKDKIVGGAFYMLCNGKTYYAMGASHPDVSAPIGHLYLWKSIQYFKEEKLRLLELGWQDISNQFLIHPNKKELDIAMFKRGFGGLRHPLYRGVKFYDASYLKEFASSQLDLLLKGV